MDNADHSQSNSGPFVTSMWLLVASTRPTIGYGEQSKAFKGRAQAITKAIGGNVRAVSGPP